MLSRRPKDGASKHARRLDRLPTLSYRKIMAAWAYMLKCADGSYYTGCTTNLDQRWSQHQAGTYSGYTSTRRPLEMVWAVERQTIYDAIGMERRVKRWSRAKKEALIRGDWDALPKLAKKGFRPSSML
jgi:putative endonuclease